MSEKDWQDINKAIEADLHFLIDTLCYNFDLTEAEVIDQIKKSIALQ
jgi:hypothetical protein